MTHAPVQVALRYTIPWVLLWFGVAGPAAAKNLMLENDDLRVSLRGDTADFTVLDKQTKGLWLSGNATSPLRLGDLRLGKGRADGTLVAGRQTFKVAFLLEGRELEVRLEAAGAADRTPVLDYPLAVRAQNQQGVKLVIPYSEGILLPVEDTALAREFNLTRRDFAVYEMFGLSMPWFGATGPGGAYMAILETPYDAAMKLGVEADRFTAQVRWKKALGQWRYPRRVRFVFFPREGYVAMAKRYRQFAFAQGVHQGRKVLTLRDEAAKNPEVKKLIGALDWWEVRKPALPFIRTLHDKGVAKLLFQNLHDNPSFVLTADQVKRIKGLGYLVSRYDVYTDVHDTSRWRRIPDWVRTRGVYQYRPGELVVNADGTPLTQAIAPQFIGGRMRRCGRFRVAQADRMIGQELARVPYNARFIDVEAAVGLFECYSRSHPCTREQDAGYRRQLLEHVKRRGLVVGTEHGNDFCIGTVHYNEGMEMLFRLMEPQKTLKSDLTGRDIDTPPGFVKFNFGEQYRVPLYQLVYHDYIVSSWRWNNTPNRYRDESYWTKFDLFQILYGTMPIVLGTADQLNQKLDRLLRTYHTVCEWHGKIGYDELVDHRALTATGTVQESRFSSGWGVVVNFGAEAYTAAAGKVEPMGCLLFRWRSS
jgi:hypothetical protein